jgi:hypothetical protein
MANGKGDVGVLLLAGVHADLLRTAGKGHLSYRADNDELAGAIRESTPELSLAAPTGRRGVSADRDLAPLRSLASALGIE